MLEKNKFNALYGMSVTNNIRNNVIFDDTEGWKENPLSNERLSFLQSCWLQNFVRIRYLSHKRNPYAGTEMYDVYGNKRRLS